MRARRVSFESGSFSNSPYDRGSVSALHEVLVPIGASSKTPRRRVAARGGKNSKKRAVVAVARKLAVLLHSLWVSAEVYEPLRNAHRTSGSQAA